MAESGGPVTKGRIVRYFSKGGPQDGIAAMIVAVKEDGMVNLRVFDEDGTMRFEGLVPRVGAVPGARREWDFAQRLSG